MSTTATLIHKRQVQLIRFYNFHLKKLLTPQKEILKEKKSVANDLLTFSFFLSYKNLLLTDQSLYLYSY